MSGKVVITPSPLVGRGRQAAKPVSVEASGLVDGVPAGLPAAQDPHAIHFPSTQQPLDLSKTQAQSQQPQILSRLPTVRIKLDSSLRN